MAQPLTPGIDSGQLMPNSGYFIVTETPHATGSSADLDVRSSPKDVLDTVDGDVELPGDFSDGR